MPLLPSPLIPSPLTRTGARAEALAGLAGLMRRTDIALAGAVIGILVVLMMPLPPLVLDLMLAVSIIFSVLILMTALFIEEPVEFSVFPTVLLIATMLRLALNIASTRLILSHGHEGPAAAGHVIEAFGAFVMGGNFIIGLIVFAILVLVNFVVITKGSGRIAEVAARFTLDAMPGKQMAIDADLSAGLIEEGQARARRKALEDEASFYGAMDGASKFVRGDAVAGLIITAINIVAGIVIGVVQKDLDLAAAAHAYTLLTVGDGLVSQVPALIVSTAAGLLVSKAGVRGAADKALSRQLAGMPKALAMSSAVMAAMALLPGIPALPFLSLALGAGLLSRAIARRAAREAEAPPDGPATAGGGEEERLTEALRIDELRLEIGYGLLPLARAADGEERLARQIRALRRELASEIGFVLPAVRIVDDARLDANAYRLRVREVEAGHGEVFPDAFMVMDATGGEVALPGLRRADPSFGLPVTWVDATLREEAEARGYTVVDAATVVTTHLSETVRAHLPELFGHAEMQKLLKDLSKDHAELLRDVCPKEIGPAALQRVFQLLLTERVPIRDLAAIVEAVAEVAGALRDPARIVEHVRSRLARQICARHLSPAGHLAVVPLAPRWETAFAESMVGDGETRQLALAPSQVAELVAAIGTAIEEAARAGESAVIVASPQVRPTLRALVARTRREVPVLSQAEIHAGLRIRQVATVS
jgi:flagellar biosynthesis protein FlhA